MLRVKIDGQTFDQITKWEITLLFDAIASVFAIELYYDPSNAVHRKIFKPYTYRSIQVYYSGVLLLTGVVLKHNYYSAGDPPKSTVKIQGYSKTGVLEDCPPVTYPLQNNGLSLLQICRATAKHYGITVKVDDEVKNAVNYVYNQTVPDPDKSVKDYLDELSKQQNVVLSHTASGELYLTKAKSDKLLTTKETYVLKNNLAARSHDITNSQFASITTTTVVKDRAILYNFQDRTNWLNMEAEYNGQDLHSDVVVLTETMADNPNGVMMDPVWNPLFDNKEAQAANAEYVKQQYDLRERGKRPRTYVQTTGDVNTRPKTARAILGDELKSVSVKIDIQGVVLNGHVVTPNQMILVKNADIRLDNTTKLFIREVILRGDHVRETATIMATLPEAYNSDPIKNPF